MNGLPLSLVWEDLHAIDYGQYRLPMLVMYDHPSDFPHHIVIRLWDMDKWTPVCHLSPDIEAAEAAIPPQFCKLAPNRADDPKIIGVYV